MIAENDLRISLGFMVLFVILQFFVVAVLGDTYMISELV